MTAGAPSTVHMVGAGPGDPLLVTRRAARLLAEADVVVTDQRSTDAVAALAGPRAVHRYVGRTPEGPAWSRARIVDLLASEAEADRSVVRLASGDLFVCSPVAAEVAALLDLGITVTTTPGVSVATAAPLAAGMTTVPGHTVTVVSGADDATSAPVDWAALADPGATLVVLAGRARQRSIANRLLAADVAPATPAWVVHAAGRPGTRVAATDLDGLRATRLQPPTAAVVGPLLVQPPVAGDGAEE